METKICSKCKEEKEISNFSKDIKNKDKLTYQCKFCKKEYNKINREKIKQKETEYRYNNPSFKLYRKQYFKSYKRNRMDIDPLFKLTEDIRTTIHHSIQRQGFSKNSITRNILGCSFEEFKQYIELKFEPWMNWENRGNPKNGVLEFNKNWDLDHIIPISSAKTEEDVIKLNHYTNFQPLCSKYNREIKR